MWTEEPETQSVVIPWPVAQQPDASTTLRPGMVRLLMMVGCLVVMSSASSSALADPSPPPAELESPDECVTDEDCSECFGECVDGDCQYSWAFNCDTDADCDEGLSCDLSICKGICIDPALQYKPEPESEPESEGPVPAGMPQPVDECSVDGDCGPCSSCELGYCNWTGFSDCYFDNDCNEGQYCGPGECGGVCTEGEKPNPREPQCETLSDCAQCAIACVDGECMYGGLDQCQKDSDCEAYGAGLTCDNSGPCGSVCAGQCINTGAIRCATDGDCGEDEECDLTLCDGTCVDVEITPECSADSDCGDCGAFCIDGECMYTGALICETDADCGEGEACDTTVCEGTCVELGSHDLASPATSGASQVGCSTTGSGAGFPGALLIGIAVLWAVRRREFTQPTAQVRVQP